MQLWKAHGLGNDYLVYEDGPALTPALTRALCDRHRGPGADGILEPAPPGTADFGVRIWNPDGSLAEKSGNGLRIFAWWLSKVRGVGADFTVWTQAERVRCVVGDATVRVEMGRFRLAPAEIPLRADHPWRDEPVDGHAVTAVGMGNPHAVIWVDGPLDDLPWRAWGAKMEVHPAFPNRTNVQIARVLAPDRAEARIWERGAGETEASGSSASAVAAAGVATGRLRRGRITVEMPGGPLAVWIGDDDGVVIDGPVGVVGRFTLDPSWTA
jgi:diaminopimelate epimerase